MPDLTKAIARNLRVRKRLLRAGDTPPPAELRTIEELPILLKPKRGAPSPILQYPYPCGQFDWTRRDWHRFQQAAYANGLQAREAVRILCQQYVEDYEAIRDAEH